MEIFARSPRRLFGPIDYLQDELAGHNEVFRCQAHAGQKLTYALWPLLGTDHFR